MPYTYMTIKDSEGRPVKDKEKARSIILDFIHAEFGNVQPQRVHVRRVDDNGLWAATI